MLSENMQNALNKQFHEELHSAYLYLSMSAYRESANLPGTAHWMRLQAREETGHAMRLYGHILQRRGRVQLATIEAPETEWKSPTAIFDEVLAHEEMVTGLIHELVALANKEKDYATNNLLQSFVDEQVEEEANANKIVQTLKMIGDSAQGLILLDRELGQRKSAAVTGADCAQGPWGASG